MILHNTISLWKCSLCAIGKRWFLHTKHGVFITASVIIREAYMPILLFFLFSVTDSIGGWSFYKMLLFQSLISITYAVLVLFFTGLRDFTANRKGSALEWAMIRPRGVLSQILLSDTDWFAVIGHGCLGIVLMVIGISGCHVDLSVGKIVMLCVNIAGGVMIQGAIWLFLAALKLMGKSTKALSDILFWIPRKFAYLPITLLPTLLANIFVYIIPYAFISYFPVLGFLGMADSNYPQFFMYLSLPVGVLLYLVAYLIWRWGLMRWLRG